MVSKPPPIWARLSLAVLVALGWTATAVIAEHHFQTIQVFGVNSQRKGAFIPAGTDLACRAIDAGRCWDRKSWHVLYPSGSRKFASPASREVACIVIIRPENDCWTGTVWYRLPPGQLFGRVLVRLGGAFVTAPLRP